MDKNRYTIMIGMDVGRHKALLIAPQFSGVRVGDYVKTKTGSEYKITFVDEYCELDASLPACIFYENRGYKTVKHIKYDIGGGKSMIYEIMRKNNDK